MRIFSNLLAYLMLIFVQQYSVFAQITTKDYSATLQNDILTLENSRICRTYKWNKGNIITRTILNKESGKLWEMNSDRPDLFFPGKNDNAEKAVFNTKIVSETSIGPKHLEAEITCSFGKLEVKRVFRIYSKCSAIATDFYFRGEFPSQTDKNEPVIEKIEFPGKHWKLDAIEFSDITDGNNNLVFETNALSYRSKMYRGNLLFAKDNLSDNGFFILKEAPTSNVQLYYPNGDFVTEFGNISAIGIGLNQNDLNSTEWKRGYGFATGVYAGGEINQLTALREYQKNIRIHQPARDEMILMNTWGDRGEDKHIGEKFALEELAAGAKLGITHFQLDAGWQKGHGLFFTQRGSINDIWRTPDYWEPHPKRFPQGLDPVVKRGKELGIEICLWFNSSRENSNKNWEKDANVLIGMYKKYGIHTFKIDGVDLPDKLAEINFRKFLDKVLLETDNQVVFNLDVTAGRRGGYHFFNEYGNLFLENRYTDSQNYYPYTTLRNLWMLSKYVPPENLQIEFLNKWRNAAKYQNDPFGPSNYSFEYLFAITMAAQPLAWFEASGLPEEAFMIAPAVSKYRQIQFDFHSGNIFPIGDEPSGKSWCGFQSIQNNKGYFLIFREANNEQKCSLKTWLTPGTKIKAMSVLGKGEAFKAKVGENGLVPFKLKDKNSYALYQYIVE